MIHIYIELVRMEERDIYSVGFKEGFKEEVTCELGPVIVFVLYCLSHLKFFPFCTSSLYLVFTFSCKHISFLGLTS